jgi:subtilisin family serine protease
LFATTILAYLVASAEGRALIDPQVHRMLQETGSANVFITMKEQPTIVTDTANKKSFKSHDDKRKEVSDGLEALAKTSQKDVLAYLKSNGKNKFKNSESFWLTNQVFIEGANADFVNELSELPSVAKVEKEEIFQIIAPVLVNNTAPASSSILAVEWGVTKIRAPDTWAAGYTGTGVVVGGIDTGVRYTHTALKAAYRADAYSWYDPVKKSRTPNDAQGHGTHTMGTIVGSGGIGVAPGAKWIACKGCATSSCSSSVLLGCLQWMYCPTTYNGKTKDCTKAPRVVNNSWGGGQGSTYFASAIETLRSGGIIPIFSAGNSGPSCGTANSPGDLPSVIAVGATDSNDAIASFSSKGPSVNGLLKPDLSAPGTNVRSSYYTSDTAYAIMSGTSMAAPHVTGLVALLLQEDPTATYDTIKSKLQNGGIKSLGASSVCGGIDSTTFPNNVYGYGRVDATNAIAL